MSDDLAVRKLLLDAKDLIELIERAHPMSHDQLRHWLTARDASVVLTYTNVTEFADCFRGVNDYLYIRAMVQALEALPISYLREGSIQSDELSAAVSAFDAGREPSKSSPYVARWDHTFALGGERPAAEAMVGYRLDLLVFDLMKQGMPRRHQLARAAAKYVADYRSVPKEARPTPRDAFIGAVERTLAFWKLARPKGDLVEFGKWIYSDPTRCPGLRLGWELVQSFISNENDTLRESDVWDNVHFTTLPYVDYATLDRRIVGYCRQISRRLRKQNGHIDYDARTYRSLSDLVKALD